MSVGAEFDDIKAEGEIDQRLPYGLPLHHVPQLHGSIAVPRGYGGAIRAEANSHDDITGLSDLPAPATEPFVDGPKANRAISTGGCKPPTVGTEFHIPDPTVVTAKTWADRSSRGSIN